MYSIIDDVEIRTSRVSLHFLYSSLSRQYKEHIKDKIDFRISLINRESDTKIFKGAYPLNWGAIYVKLKVREFL